MILASIGIIAKAPAAGGGGLTNITFSSVSGTFTESPSGRWGAGVGHGLSSLTMPASTEAYIQHEYAGTDNRDAILGADIDNTLENYTGWSTGVFVSSTNSNIYYVNGGSIVNSAIAAQVGDLLRIKRTAAGTITAEYSRTSGASWNVLFDYTTGGPYTAVLYIKGNVASAGNYLLNPKGSGIV